MAVTLIEIYRVEDGECFDCRQVGPRFQINSYADSIVVCLSCLRAIAAKAEDLILETPQ